MTVRHVALITLGVATLGLCVYLLIAVNSAAAPVEASAEKPTVTRVAERERTEKKARDEEPRRSVEKKKEPTLEPRPNDAEPRPGEGVDVDLDKDEVMASANKAYDRGNLDEAMDIAKKVLANDPTNARMLRIMVSSSCILDDTATAQKNYLLLPAGSADRETMRVRCARYGVQFSE